MQNKAMVTYKDENGKEIDVPFDSEKGINILLNIFQEIKDDPGLQHEVVDNAVHKLKHASFVKSDELSKAVGTAMDYINKKMRKNVWKMGIKHWWVIVSNFVTWLLFTIAVQGGWHYLFFKSNDNTLNYLRNEQQFLFIILYIIGFITIIRISLKLEELITTHE